MSRTTADIVRQVRQAVDRALGIGHAIVGAALHQRIHQNRSAPNAVHDLACPEPSPKALRIAGMASSKSPNLALTRRIQLDDGYYSLSPTLLAALQVHRHLCRYMNCIPPKGGQ
jgi:hypothetical protein